MKVKLTFDVRGLWYYIRDKYTNQFLDVKNIVLFESDNSLSKYYPIEIIKYSDSISVITTENASDSYLDKFYRIRFYKDFFYKDEVLKKRQELTDDEFQFLINQSTLFDLYDFEKGYVFQVDKLIPDIITDIIDKVRESIGDLNLDDPAFSDEEYTQMIKFALKQIKGETNLLYIHPDDIELILLLVRESTALKIAYDYAKYYKLTAPGVELDKSEIYRHYLDVANALRASYESYAKRLNLQNGGYNDQGIINQMPSFDVIDMRRKNYISGVYEDKGDIYPTKFDRIYARTIYSDGSLYFKVRQNFLKSNFTKSWKK